jgi:hypothetical protein
MTQTCALCGGACDVMPKVPLIVGKGVPGGFGLWVNHGKFCCADCARRVAMLFATRNTPTRLPSDDGDSDDTEALDDKDFLT